MRGIVVSLLLALVCLVGATGPARADAKAEATARIAALTDEQTFEVFVAWVTENAEDCDFTVDRTADNTDVEKELISRWRVLAEISDDLQPLLEQELMERVDTVDGEALANLYFVDVIVDDTQTTFVLPDCVAGLS